MKWFACLLVPVFIFPLQVFATDAPKDDPGLGRLLQTGLELRLVLRDGDAPGKDFEFDGEKLRVDSRSVIDAKDVKTAFPLPEVGSFSISVRLTEAGGRKMKAFTEKHVGERLAIFANGKILSAPMIQGSFGREFQITGKFTLEEAERLAASLSR
ncbi:MAG: hypothetical protein AAGJ79_15485 [Verrucomicrobiota bacterium]